MADALSPEEQIAALRRELAQRDAVIAGLSSERDANQAKLAAVLLEIEHIKMQLATLRRQRFGRSSEKLDRDIDQLEMRLEDLEETAGEQIAAYPHPPPDPEDKSKAELRRKSAGRKPLPAHLPRETVLHEPEIACTCGSCDPRRLTRLGESTTEVLEKIPATLKVIRHVRPKYACRLCERIFQAPAPDLPIEKGRPGPALLAHVAISKYCDGMPLYRQAAILAREGIEIDRATMAEWMGHVAWWVMPLAELLGRTVMAQAVIWTDDTPIRTLAPGTGKTRLSRFWCYAADPRPYQGAGHPAVCYHYSADRKGERPRSHLEGFSGYLHADAFAGYDALYRSNGRQPPRIAHVACMAELPKVPRAERVERQRRCTPGASCSRCSRRRSRRLPRKGCGVFRNSTPLRPTSKAGQPSSGGPSDKGAASRCSMHFILGPRHSDGAFPARRHSARLCSIR
jgi:transposase